MTMTTPTTTPTTTTAAEWTEYKTPEGKPYWFHTITRQSVWAKPDVLKTPEEKLREACPWKEFKNDKGKKYWHNSQTKESTWKMPPEYEEMLAKAEQLAKKEAMEEDARSTVTPSIAPSAAHSDGPRGITGSNMIPVGTRGPADKQAAAPIPVFDTKEDAEEAFIQMLYDREVDWNLSWEDAMRKIIRVPLYRALNTTMERKDAYLKYCSDARRKERERNRLQAEKQRDDVRALLKNDARIRSVTRYSKACLLYEKDPVWLAVTDERDRRAYFDEYLDVLRKKEKDDERDLQKAQVEKLTRLLKSTNSITEQTQWDDLEEALKSNPEYAQDESLQNMDPMGKLITFEDHIKTLEKRSAEIRYDEKDKRARQERVNRDNFKALLESLRKEGKMQIFTRWKELFPFLEFTKEYDRIVGQPGSTPMDLYRDLVVRIEDEVYPARKLAQAIMKDAGFAFTEKTKYVEFEKVLLQDPQHKQIDPLNYENVYLELQDRAIVKFKEEQHRQEKKKRRIVDELKRLYRSATAPPLTPATSYEQAKQQFIGRSAFEAADDETRLEVFEYVVARLREKLQENYKLDSAMALDYDADVVAPSSRAARSDGKRLRSTSRKRGGDADGENEKQVTKKTKSSRRPPDYDREEGEASTSEDEL